jgi:hypothetical protein
MLFSKDIIPAKREADSPFREAMAIKRERLRYALAGSEHRRSAAPRKDLGVPDQAR